MQPCLLLANPGLPKVIHRLLASGLITQEESRPRRGVEVLLKAWFLSKVMLRGVCHAQGGSAETFMWLEVPLLATLVMGLSPCKWSRVFCQLQEMKVRLVWPMGGSRSREKKRGQSGGEAASVDGEMKEGRRQRADFHSTPRG